MASSEEIEKWQRKWEKNEPKFSDREKWDAWQRAKEKDMP